MLEALIVNPQFVVVSVLYNVEHVVSYLERVLEIYAEFLHLIHHHSILENLFLSTQVATDQLYRCRIAIQTELPHILHFRSRKFRHMYCTF